MDPERLALARRVAMIAWRAHVAATRSGAVRPVDGRQAYAAGRRALRVLLIGSGPVVGWGVSSHDLALPGAVARALAASTGRGAVVDAVPHPSAGVQRLRRLVAAAGVDRYDAVVLSAAVADAIRMKEPRVWAEHLRLLLTEVRAVHPGPVVWLGAQPIVSIRPYDSANGRVADAHARRLNALAGRICREVGAIYVGLNEPTGRDTRRHRSPADYLFWARQIVDALATALQVHEPQRPAPANDSASRTDAIGRLKLSQRGGDERLDGIVATAKRTLGADIAMFTVLDDRNEWPLSSTAAVHQQIGIEESACIHTIQSPDGMVVPNASEDDRFSENTLVTGPARLRYYAGYPVEAPDGTRIGALCVFGRSPRPQAEGEADLDVLRELAMLAQRELWRWAPEG